MARPSKLTDEVQDRIVRAIRAGNYAEAACHSAGISSSTFYRWMTRGDAEAGAYRVFREAVLQAEAEAEVHAVAIIRRAMTDDWRAAMAYLERRYPSRWRRHQTTELTGELRSHHAEPDFSQLSDDDLATLEELTRRAGDVDPGRD